MLDSLAFLWDRDTCSDAYVKVKESAKHGMLINSFYVFTRVTLPAVASGLGTVQFRHTVVFF
jgi:hypothetical protein